MKISQIQWVADRGWSPEKPGKLGDAAQLVMVFGHRSVLSNLQLLNEVEQAYPKAHLLGCSTAGEICDVEVWDKSLVVTAIQFEHTEIVGHSVQISDTADGFQAGEHLAQKLSPDGLSHVFVLSDGLNVNGSELVRGLVKHLPETVTITGGLSGDGAHFEQTLVMWNAAPKEGVIVAIGLYGDRLTVGCGSGGGWDAFGPERLVTKAKGNVLYQLDGKSALSLYKQYLGEHAAELPGSGLLFPLKLRTDADEMAVVRTILSVDEGNQSMTFAGDVPEGSHVQLMKANFEQLVDGAIVAAKKSLEGFGQQSPELAICISCVGRKLVLKQQIEEEIEGVRDVLGDKAVLTGFYSYGEIAPFKSGVECVLHNQTMTITTLSEA